VVKEASDATCFLKDTRDLLKGASGRRGILSSGKRGARGDSDPIKEAMTMRRLIQRFLVYS